MIFRRPWRKLRLTRRGIRVEANGVRLVGSVWDWWLLYDIADRKFEPQTVEQFVKIISPGAVVLDVGAYLGYYSVLAARAVGSNGKVYAFEPDPQSYRRLVYNLTINQCRNAVASSIALGARKSAGYLYRRITTPMVNSLVPRRVGYGSTPRQRVEVDAADNLIQVPKVDVIKIDVEGAEVSVLRGMVGLLQRSPDPALFIEVHARTLQETGGSITELHDLLGDMGFRHLQRLDEEPDIWKLYCRREMPVD